jgi:DNA-binding CsgD family transcriptional regulator/tetratricopeptide (TPR) repeat protein
MVRSPDTLVERAAEAAALDDHLEAVRRREGGRVVLVAGEAGIGKTALVTTFRERHEGVRSLVGACDALHTPRPLGPLIDIAEEIGGELAAVADSGATPGAVAAGLAAALRTHDVLVLVLEDLHWADEATLDVVRLLARRLESLPMLLVATYRDDELDRSHPLRVLVGELPRSVVHRIALRRLSAAGVAELARGREVDARELHRLTSGNPFFVTEVLAAEDGAVPDSVRDVVLARAARLGDGERALLDAVAILPPRAELWLLEPLVGPAAGHLESCLASGMLHADRSAVAFRHEIARVAIEDALPPDRRQELHRRALAALATAPGRTADPARLAHHAEAAAMPEAVLRHAWDAASEAARLGAHREAAAQYARALRVADGARSELRADLLDRRSYECYLTGDLAGAIGARREALCEHQARDDCLREGDSRRWLSRLLWLSGESDGADEEAQRAIALLEPLPPGRELAMAYGNVAQVRMLSHDLAGASLWGSRAIELAERLNDVDILAHALNTVGTAELQAELSVGWTTLMLSLELAAAAGLDEHVARAQVNLAASAIAALDHDRADVHLDAGIAFCSERDLDVLMAYLTGLKARCELGRGRWDSAMALAVDGLSLSGVTPVSRIHHLLVIGTLRARRGDPDPWTPLAEASELAARTGTLQRAPVAAARAEACWLAGRTEEVAAETDAALALALFTRDGRDAGAVGVWRHRAGLGDPLAYQLAEPWRSEVGGDHAGAAARWERLGCPYEAALALCGSDSEDALRRSHAELQRLGAQPAASRVARLLRERGVRGIQRGPRAATRQNLAGLTPREVEILQLVAEGRRTPDIAAQLFLSQRTVHHHVSAILRKLAVTSRGQAVAEAVRLGIVRR